MPRVYLCDDERAYRDLIRTVLSLEEGLDVVGEGGDGGFCLEDAAQTDPDVILLDVNMPGVSGLDALPQLRRAMPDAHVIMLSSASPQQYEDEALRAGASGFIQKPRNVFDLPAMVRGKLADAGMTL